MTLEEVVELALEAMEAHEEGSAHDAEYDAGEYSGPAHDRMLEKEITSIAEENGFTYDQVMDEIHKQNSDPESQSSKHCDPGYMNDMRFGE